MFNHYYVIVVLNAWYTFDANAAVGKREVKSFDLVVRRKLIYDRLIIRSGFDFAFNWVEVKKLYFDFRS